MRPLDEKETTVVFEKLMKFTGKNLANVVNRPLPNGEEGGYVFRLQKQKVYYCSASIVRRATNVSRERLYSLGTCIGKFTKSGQFSIPVICFFFW